MKIIQITESKLGNLSDCAEKMLYYGGMMMSCLKELQGDDYSEEGYGERGYGERGYGDGGGNYGQRMGHRGYEHRMPEPDPSWNDMDRFPGNNPYYRSDKELSERRGR